MIERNHLSNGRFVHDLDNWVASGAEYSAGDGDDHYGVAVLSTGGDYVEQTFSVPRVRAYSLHIGVKAIGVTLSGSNVVAKITDGDGNTVLEQDLSGAADTWTETTVSLGLGSGTTYTLRITNDDAGADVRIDDVWIWHVPITRAAVVARVVAKLARLASDRSLSSTASGSLTEGDYTYAMDAGLRSVGAINPETGSPDVRYLGPDDVNALIDAVEREMLEQLRRDYAVEVDFTLGPRRESLSQISKAIGELAGGQGGGSEGRRPVVKRLIHD
jgi:cold shock CspA family protein